MNEEDNFFVQVMIHDAEWGILSEELARLENASEKKQPSMVMQQEAIDWRYRKTIYEARPF